jgi:hypothetical protein
MALVIAAVPTTFCSKSEGIAFPLTSEPGGLPVDGPDTVASTEPAPSEEFFCDGMVFFQEKFFGTHANRSAQVIKLIFKEY